MTANKIIFVDSDDQLAKDLLEYAKSIETADEALQRWILENRHKLSESDEDRLIVNVLMTLRWTAAFMRKYVGQDGSRPPL